MNKIIFKPYDKHHFLLNMMVGFSIIIIITFFIMVRYKRNFDCLVLLLLLIAITILMIKIHRQMKIVYIFDNYGITVNDCKKHYFKYAEFSNIYYCVNYKGHLLLIFSKKELENYILKKIVQKHTLTDDIFIEQCLVVFIHPLNKDLSIIDFIYKKFGVKPN